MIRIKELAKKLGLFSTVVIKDKENKAVTKGTIYDLKGTELFRHFNDRLVKVCKTQIENVFILHF